MFQYIEHLKEIRPISFGDIVWSVDGTRIKNGRLVCHPWIPFANGTNLICHSPSHSPMLSLIFQRSIICRKKSRLPISTIICRLHIICQRIVSFTDRKSCLPFANYLPKDCLIYLQKVLFAFAYYLPKDCLIYRQKVLFALSTLSFSKPSPTFTKRGRKNIFNAPKQLP